MSFHLGKPILVMLCVVALAGVGVAMRPDQRQADLTLWVFADSHYKSYQTPLQNFRDQSRLSVNMNLVAGAAMDLRLSNLFLSDPTSPELADVVEIEISWIGKYLRPPTDQVALLPLNEFLKESGWLEQIVPQRLAPWTKEGVIFGIPHDVHPVTITYRHDLFDKAGVDLEAVKTWPEFHGACLRFNQYWREQGVKHRHAFEAGPSATELIQVILLQRGINLVDQSLQVHINHPKVAQTVAFYAQLVAGPRKVSSQSAAGEGALIRDILDGNLCSFLTADWRAFYFKRWASSIPGTLRMIPLPRFDPTDPPTSTWGGTMIGITKACKRPRDAWKLIEHLYFDETSLETRREESGVLPPLMSHWDRPAYQQPDSFYSGNQKASALFVELGRQVPVRYQTPVSTIAASALTFVLNRAVAHVNEHGSADGLEEACQVWLDEAARDLDRRIAHWRFD